jgi:hypothetical protein
LLHPPGVQTYQPLQVLQIGQHLGLKTASHVGVSRALLWPSPPLAVQLANRGVYNSGVTFHLG